MTSLTSLVSILLIDISGKRRGAIGFSKNNSTPDAWRSATVLPNASIICALIERHID